ncbi:MAG TPA: hypothetical protein VJ949_13360 [Cryomorphaceae bacterium]|nr:hypothetical protein [Cryomorphaceae bacterium]
MRTRDKLIDKIRLIEDESVLVDLIRIIDLELELAGDSIELSEDQKDFVEEGLKDYKKGKTLSHNEAKRHTEEWLRKK